jgi:hypothetical protein
MVLLAPKTRVAEIMLLGAVYACQLIAIVASQTAQVAQLQLGVAANSAVRYSRFIAKIIV